MSDTRVMLDLMQRASDESEIMAWQEQIMDRTGGVGLTSAHAYQVWLKAKQRRDVFLSTLDYVAERDV